MSLNQQVNLDDPISKFLPDSVKTPSAKDTQITLLHLVTHRAGFPRNPYNMDPKNWDNPFADYTPDRLYEYVSAFNPEKEINREYKYSNVGFNLLGHILTLVTGQNFGVLVKEKISEPLGMEHTLLLPTPELRKNLAQPHLPHGKPGTEWDIALAAGGGLRSSANDMLTFAAANLGLVKSSLTSAIELSHQQQAKKEGNAFMAMGWTLSKENGGYILWKDGSTGGYCTFIGLDKKNKRGVVVLSNSDNRIQDIGKHLLDSNSAIVPYQYKWKIFETIFSTVEKEGVDKAIKLYQELNAQNKASYIFDENQLKYVGDELRKSLSIAASFLKTSMASFLLPFRLYTSPKLS